MAAQYVTPQISDAISIKEAVVVLSFTGYPVTDKQLEHWLADARLPRQRIKGTDFYSMSAVWELHRDRIDQGSLRATRTALN